MDETSKIVLTALWAIIIYVVGKLLERIIVDPMVELRKAVGEVDFALVFYANLWGNPLNFPEREQEPPPEGVVEEYSEGARAIREKGARLSATANAIVLHGFLARLGFVPGAEDIEAAKANLIGLGNGFFKTDPSHNERRRKAIERALGLDRRQRGIDSGS